MWRRGRLGLILLAGVGAIGCDWDYYAFLNTIPLSEPTDGEVHVLFAVDGLAEDTITQLISEGHFSEPTWRFARVVSVFPSTSTIAWTRIMHSNPIEGYEYQYYDAEADEVVGFGYWGIFTHTIPWLLKPYYLLFDFRSNGLLNHLFTYADTWLSISETLDNIFMLIDGRVRSTNEPVTTVLTYVAETDAIAHIMEKEQTIKAICEVERRIKQFRKQLKGRKLVATILSDHGHNFEVCDHEGCLIRLQKVLEDLGVRIVESLNNQPQEELVAIPIMHTRVNYLAIHARPHQTEEIARRASTEDSVDFAVSLISAPDGEAAEFPWYGLWKNGEVMVRFAFDSTTDTYWIDQASDFSSMGLPWPFPTSGVAAFSDEQLFGISAHSDCPDVFYRVRTGLQPVGTRFPAQVLISFAAPNGSIGFENIGGVGFSTAYSWHGGLRRADTNGIVLTEEPGPLPAYIRADNVLSFFPEIKKRALSRGADAEPNDPNEELDYSLVENWLPVE